MKTYRVMGLDISTQTGLAIVEASNSSDINVIEAMKIASKPDPDRFFRWHGYTEHVIAAADKYKPNLVVIEGYGYANKHTLATLVEVGAVIRYALFNNGNRFIEAAPNTLKMFLTGKGQGDKNLMMLQLFKNYGFETDDDDICDAIIAGLFGLQLLGLPLTMAKTKMRAVDKWRSGNDEIARTLGL